jgi:hypothetical protein
VAKATYQIALELRSPAMLVSNDDAEDFFEIYCTCLPNFLPDRLNSYEPLRHPFDADNPKANAARWKGGILASRRRRPAVSLMVMAREDPIYATHSIISMMLRLGKGENVNVMGFCKALHDRFGVDFGCVLIFGAPHLKLGLSSRTVTTTKGKPVGFVIPHMLFYKYTPDLYWLTIFGHPYTRAMGTECFLNAPAFRTELWKDNTVMVQLSGDIWDAVNDPESYESNWLRVKSTINRDIFFQVGKLSGYRLPDWPPVPDQLRKSWDTPPADERLETPQQRERFVNMLRHLMSRGRRSHSKPE